VTAARILVVDDTPTNVKLLADLLSVNGFDVITAGSGGEGLERAGADAPDLVLLDVMMPDLDGFTVCERLKANAATRDVPVIFLTALTETLDKVRAFAAGGVDYLSKPFEPRELLARVSTHLTLRRAQRELEGQNARLREEIEAHQRSRAIINCLQDEIRTGNDFREIIGRSPVLARMLDQLALVASTHSTVLILGETGTGKELVARAIHDRSPRRERPLVKLNCAALPRELVESELFGHEKGAFTGATQQRRGRFELADGGTLFLDEVGELPLEAQAKLLRVLQEQEFERVGGTRSLRTDVRVIAGTNRDLEAQVSAGGFRSDLFYRLNVFPVTVPPLRDRREDIPPLVAHFLAKSARKLGKAFEGASPAFLERAMAYAWPGNVRELENAVERAAILARGSRLEALEPFTPAGARAHPDAAPAPPPDGTLEDVERAHIRRVLDQTRWAIEGKRGAAAVLGINPSTLRGRMRKLGIRKAG
jgi:DNA-binding NtrC family response regulator